MLSADRIAAAVKKLREAVLAEAALTKKASQAKSPSVLAGELSEEELDAVRGGARLGPSVASNTRHDP
jgi:hypothetical protein